MTWKVDIPPQCRTAMDPNKLGESHVDRMKYLGKQMGWEDIYALGLHCPHTKVVT